MTECRHYFKDLNTYNTTKSLDAILRPNQEHLFDFLKKIKLIQFNVINTRYIMQNIVKL